MGLFSILKDRATLGGPSVALEELNTPTARAKSAFLSSTGTHSKHARFEELQEKAPEAVALAVQSSAKSFSAGSTRTIQPQPADARQQEKQDEGPSPKDVKYTSVNQFQSMVELYRGSISTVYRATCSLTKAPVIIKAYQKSKMKEKNFLRMEREIRLMRLLEGEVAIVQLYNVFEDTGFKYLVMETCKGGDLFKAMLLRGGKMDERWVCNEMVAPLLRTLVGLHAQHIIHRDIKPENIFLTARQEFKLGDFGLAIQSSLELPYTRSGTLDYLSPEVLANPMCELQESPKVTRADLKQRGVRPYDEKVDCWAAGVLAYELVVGRPPFEVKDEAKTASAIMYSNDFPLPSKYSAQWAAFVKQALMKNPALRPSAAQLLEHPWVKQHTARAEAVLLPELDLPALSLSKRDLRSSHSMGPTVPAPREAPSPSLNAAQPNLDQGKSLPAPHSKEHSMQWGDARSGSGHLPPSPLGMKPQEKQQQPFAPGRLTVTATADASDSASPKSVLEFPASPMSVSDFSSSSERQSGSPLSKAATGTPRGQPASHKTDASLQLESSGGSFTALLARAPTGKAGYIDSGDVLEEHERRAGGLRIRMKHYFKKQATQQSGPPVL